MIEVILINILIQLVYFVGFVFLAGFLISLCNRLFYKTVNQKKAVCYATGFLGTPIHELSHALFCLIFFHKIEEIKLFQIDDENGVLGYVRHSYNKKNLWALLGNYFIGVAPILCGTAIVYLMTWLLLPEASAEITAYMNDLIMLESGGLSWSWITYSAVALSEIVQVFFTSITVGWRWWVFALVVLCIALHMNLSGADVKGALKGVPFFAIIFIVINLLLGFCFLPAYNSFIGVMNIAGSYLLGTLMLSLIFSLFYLALGGLVNGICAIVSRIKLLKK